MQVFKIRKRFRFKILSVKIVSLAPSNTEVLFALEVGDQVVACTTYCDFPPEAKYLPKVGGWTTVSLDLIRKFKPDLVLTSTIVQQDAPIKFRDERFKVVHFDVRTLDDIYKSIRQIGELTGQTTNAKRLTQNIKDKLSKLRSSLVVKPLVNPRVYIEEWMDPAMASGNWVTELIEIAGGMSILEKGEISRSVSYSEVAGFDPDIIVLAYCGYMDKSDPTIIKKRWPNLRAVKDGKIFVIDERILNRPGPRIWQAAEELGKIIH